MRISDTANATALVMQNYAIKVHRVIILTIKTSSDQINQIKHFDL